MTDPQIGTTKDDLKMQVDSLLDKSFYYLRRDLDLSIRLSMKADSLTKLNHYPKGRARSLRSRAYHSYFSNKPDQALVYLDESEQIELQYKNIKGLASTYNSKAWLFKKLDLYEDALECYKKVTVLQDTLISDQNKITSYNNIANIYTYLSKHDSALVFYNNALTLSKSQKDSVNTAIISTNLGNTHSLLLNNNAAESYYLEALSICKKTENLQQIAKIYNNLGALFYEKGNDNSALYYFEQSIDVKKQLQDSFALAKSYFNIAELYSENHEYTYLANEYLLLSEDIFSKVSNEHLTKILLFKADRYKQNKDFFKAKRELEKAEKILESSSEIATKSQVYKSQAEVLNKIGMHNLAFEKHQQHVALNDSILNADKLWDVAEQEKKHLIKIKQNEISLLEKDKIIANANALKNQEENKKLLLSLGGAIVILILLSLLIIYFYRLRKTETQLAIQQETLLKREIQNMVDEQELHIVNATLDARKKEKEVMSKELHNNIGSLLTSAKYHFESFDEELLFSDQSTKSLYLKTSNIIDNIIDEIRALSHRFDKDSLPGFNLKNAVTEFLKKVESNQLSVYSSIHGLDSFQNSEVSVFIFRALQELVNNVLKHAHATKLTIYITRNSDGINIMVEDNGKGFDPEISQTGIGLKNLQKQIEELNGEHFVDSNIGRGTTININIPITDKV